jgi:hypothetical protein
MADCAMCGRNWTHTTAAPVGHKPMRCSIRRLPNPIRVASLRKGVPMTPCVKLFLGIKPESSLAAGADPNFTAVGRSCLANAIARSDSSTPFLLLRHGAVPVDSTTFPNEAPLLAVAVEQGDPELFGALLKAGAAIDPDDRLFERITRCVRQTAEGAGRGVMAALLIEAGCDPPHPHQVTEPSALQRCRWSLGERVQYRGLLNCSSEKTSIVGGTQHYCYRAWTNPVPSESLRTVIDVGIGWDGAVVVRLHDSTCGTGADAWVRHDSKEIRVAAAHPADLPEPPLISLPPALGADALTKRAAACARCCCRRHHCRA